jgi:hypothetical protein
MKKQAKLTGLSCLQIEHEPAENRPMAMYWMTDKLLDETVQAWSGIYGRKISRNEAVEILRNIANFYELVRAK